MPIQNRFDPKHPSDSSFFTFDFTAWLPTGVTVASLVGVNVYLNVGGNPGAVGDITQPAPAVLAGNKVTARLAGGTSGTDYIVSYSIVRSDGDDDTRSAYLLVGPV